MKINIIVVEDEARVRDSISSYIMELGSPFHLVGCASDGVEAIKLLEKNLTNIVLTDIEMPKMDGLHLIKQISERWPETKTVILSGYDRFEYVRQAMKFGVKDYLLKPIQKEELKGVLVNLSSHLRDHSKKHLSIMTNLEKWDMALIRLETKLFDAIDKGNTEEAKIALHMMLHEINHKVDHDHLRLLPFIVDSFISLRKRLTSFETVPDYFDQEWKKFLATLDPQDSFEIIEHKVCEFVIFCTTKVMECRKQSCPSVLFACQQFLQENYMKEISLQELAAIGGVAPSYLSRLFTKELGINYTDYLNQIRMEKAKELLAIPHIKVLEVASKVGFNNPHYFTRVFKKFTGMTAQEYQLERVGLS
ncbi:response regulator [Neobacillus cucumis]|uniref:DNA-binding response regulator n=1 Tax=Neobacillus cucumis TaxID=1740721 RepID=A0A2N5HVT5_9BACI|nr:response regulator [Neobacillus cucumis]PLS09629.1 hypothetical protein CVD27_01985 [Neobacillus cucumis]